jgi:hypothetical protein
MIKIAEYRANSREGHVTILSGDTVSHAIYLSRSFNMTIPSFLMVRESHVNNDMVGVFRADLAFDNKNLLINNLVMRVEGNLGFHYLEVVDTLTIETCTLIENGEHFLTADVLYQTDATDLSTLLRFYIEKDANSLTRTPIAKIKKDLNGCQIIELIHAKKDIADGVDCRCGEIIKIDSNTITTINKTYKANPTKSNQDIYLFPTVPNDQDVDMATFSVLDQDYIADKRLLIQIPRGVKLNGVFVYQRCLEHGKYDFFYDADDKNWVTEKEYHPCDIKIRSGEVLMLNSNDEYEMLNVGTLSRMTPTVRGRLTLNSEIDSEMLNIAEINKKVV